MISPVGFAAVAPARPTVAASWSLSKKLGSETLTFSAAKDASAGKTPVYKVSLRGYGTTQELRSDRPPKGRDPVQWAQAIRRLYEGGLNPKQAAQLWGPVASDLAALKAGEIDAAEFAATFSNLVPRS